MINKNETLFVIGSGPSLNKLDLTKLKGYHTIGMNRQYIAFSEWGFLPTYYVVIDPQLIPTIHKDVEKLIKGDNDIKKFFIMNGPAKPWLQQMKSQYPNKVVPLSIKADERLSKGGPLDNRPMSFVGNAGACAVEIGLQLGYKKVVLLGIDAHYVDRNESIKVNKDLSHFHPNYFDVNTFVQGVNQGPHRNDGDAGVKYWRLFSKQQKNITDFEVVSSTPDSRINQFLEYVEFNSLFVEDEKSSDNTSTVK